MFNQGIDVIEVADDGCGVPMASRPLLAMKHATSKILSFDDIYNDTIIDGQAQMSSLGFRGEALFSLANISQNMIISTKTESDELGQKLEFRKDGFLDTTKTIDVSRKVGTTVAIIKLFDALPVRRVDLIKRIKIQRQNLIKLIQSYAVLCVGINFTLTDVTGTVGSTSTKTETKLSTSGKSNSIQETVSSVLGSKFYQGLSALHIDLSPAVEDAIRKSKAPPSCSVSDIWKVEGLVSKAPCTDSNGKVARDIQFFSMNGRPVDLPTVSKILSDVWKNFEPTTGDSLKKRPACVLNFYLPKCMFDVNVSPDKREVFISEDSIIYDCIRHGVYYLWSSQQSKFNSNQCHDRISDEHHKASILSESLEHNTKQEPSLSTVRMKRRNAFANDIMNIGTLTSDKYIDTSEEKTDPTYTESNPITPRENKEQREEESWDESKFNDARKRKLVNKDSSVELKKWSQTKLAFNAGRSDEQQKDIIQILTSQNLGHGARQISSGTMSLQSKARNEEYATVVSISPFRSPDESIRTLDTSNTSSSSNVQDIESLIKDDEEVTVYSPTQYDKNRNRDIIECKEIIENRVVDVPEDIIWHNFGGTESIIEQSKASIASSIAMKRSLESVHERRNKSTGHNNESDIMKSNTDKTISLAKDDFLSMTILGQFNLGFVLALCNSGHLWILDQHACDEKFNFEKLCKESKIQEQNLLAPLPLELSPSEENCVLENIDIFEKNGFKFQFDDKKAIRHRLSLIAIPHNGSGGDGRAPVTFGAEDVGALCALLGADGETSSSGYIAGSGTGADGGGSAGNNAVRRHAGSMGGVIRLPKSVAMFASRACRSSVMIGEALSKTKMDDIIKRLYELEQPWTCAHGRPTIRHIRDVLDQLLGDEGRNYSIDFS